MTHDTPEPVDEFVARAAYLAHLDNCAAGCRPIPARGSWPGFEPGTGEGCWLGKKLAAEVQRRTQP